MNHYTHLFSKLPDVQRLLKCPISLMRVKIAIVSLEDFISAMIILILVPAQYLLKILIKCQQVVNGTVLE